MKAVAQIHFEISCTQDFQILFLKEQWTHLGYKKNTGQLFFQKESVYEISKPNHSPFKRFKFHRKVENH